MDRRALTDNEKHDAGPPQADDDNAKRSRIRHALDTLPGVIKVYREMRADQLDHMKGRSLVDLEHSPRGT